MLKKVQNFIQKHNLLPTTCRLIVGVSGGADSVVLLHVLNQLGYHCIACHCNFNLRKEESLRDKSFVQQLAFSMNIPFQSIDFDTTKYATERKISIEMAARELRYDWFEKIRISQQAQFIVVGHHADDNIETMLMNLVRGTGIEGMKGMPVKNGYIVRPLLNCSRMDIEHFCTMKRLSFITDSSNLSSEYTRNKFRNIVIPLLEEINPSVRKTLYDTIERFKGIDSVYRNAIHESINDVCEIRDNACSIDIEKLLSHQHQSTLLFEIIHPYGFNSSQGEQIWLQLKNQSGKIFYSDKFQLIKDRKYLLITPLLSETTNTVTINQFNTTIESPVRLQLTLMENNLNFQVSRDARCMHLDADLIKLPFTVRSWKKGDSFYPLGMTQRKKISDFFIDSKFNLNQKKQTYLIESEDKIVCIIGCRPDNRYRITSSTKQILEIKLLD